MHAWLITLNLLRCVHDNLPNRRLLLRPQGGGREASITRYRRVKCVGHPLAQADGCQYEHRVVLFNKIGEGTHKCYWCSKELTWKGPGPRLVVDHLNDDRWDNNENNLVPSCRTCNSHRVTNPLFQTHCQAGHLLVNNSYIRPDGKGRFCSACAAIRERNRLKRSK